MFSPELREGAAAGDITVSIRLRTLAAASGRAVVTRGMSSKIDSVEVLPFSAITDDDIVRSGEPDREVLRQRAAHAGAIAHDTLVYRIVFHVVYGTSPTGGTV